jgi:radical SAM protein with 4Fe4S-binding SPASM domain
MPQEITLYQRLMHSTAARLAPFTVMCHLTFRCPLKCKHCYVDAPKAGVEELSLAEYEGIFDQLAAAGVFFLTFSGGEVLARGDFLDILAAARRRNFAVRIFTAAWGLTADVAAEIARLHPAAVEISLHAARAELHDAFVGRAGSWEAAVAAARRLRELDVPLVLKMNVMNFNVGEIKPLYEMAAALGAEFRQSPFISAANDGDATPARMRMSDEQLRRYFEILRDWDGEEAPPYEGCDEESPARSRPNHYVLSCMAGFNNCSIDPYGVVWPCVALPFDVGDLRREPFDAIWRGDGMNRVRAYAREVVEACAACEHSVYCFRCAASALLEDGDITAAGVEHCRVAKAMQEVYGPRR